jgi:hypothetical protein
MPGATSLGDEEEGEMAGQTELFED